MLKYFILIILTTWFVTSCLIDFVIVPTVFKTLPDFFMAGDLGIRLFAIYNWFEIILAFTLFLLSLADFVIKKKKVLLLTALVLCNIAFYSKLHLTPKIEDASRRWKLAETGTAQYRLAKQDHSNYHGTYIKLDSAKLIILLFGLGFSLYRNRKDEILSLEERKL